jgi:hypothetical protein
MSTLVKSNIFVMKSFLLFASIVFAVSGYAQETRVKPKLKLTEGVAYSTTTSSEDADPIFKNVKGLVHVETSACKTYIEIMVEGGTMRIFPTNLSHEFAQDNLWVVFDYMRTSDQFPQGCSIVTAVEVDKVRKQK